MANAAFPLSDEVKTSIKQGFGILDGMANRGNVYIESQCRRLRHLQSALDPQTGIQDSTSAEIPNSADSIIINSNDTTGDTCSTGTTILAGSDIQPACQFPSINEYLEANPEWWEEVSRFVDININTGMVKDIFSK